MTGRPLPIRWLLTGLYTGLLILAMLLFGGVIYFGLRFELNDNLGEQLRGQLDLVRSNVVIADGRLSLNRGNDDELNDEQFVRLWDTSGALRLD